MGINIKVNDMTRRLISNMKKLVKDQNLGLIIDKLVYSFLLLLFKLLENTNVHTQLVFKIIEDEPKREFPQHIPTQTYCIT